MLVLGHKINGDNGDSHAIVMNGDLLMKVTTFSLKFMHACRFSSDSLTQDMRSI